MFPNHVRPTVHQSSLAVALHLLSNAGMAQMVDALSPNPVKHAGLLVLHAHHWLV